MNDRPKEAIKNHIKAHENISDSNSSPYYIDDISSSLTSKQSDVISKQDQTKLSNSINPYEALLFRLGSKKRDPQPEENTFGVTPNSTTQRTEFQSAAMVTPNTFATQTNMASIQTDTLTPNTFKLPITNKDDKISTSDCYFEFENMLQRNAKELHGDSEFEKTS